MTNEQLQAKVDYAFANEFNHTNHAYIDIAEDLIAGTLLSQIMYWFSPTKDGRSKIKVRKNGVLWLAKSRTDWEEEIRISPKQYDRAIRILSQKNLVEVKLFKFDGVPTTHIRPVYENINACIVDWKNKKAEQIRAEEENEIYQNSEMEFTQRSNLNLPKGKNRIYPKGKMEIDESVNSITETTTKTTTENTTENNVTSKDVTPHTPKTKKTETTKQLFERLIVDYNISEPLTDKMRDWITYKTERNERYKEQGLKALLSRVAKEEQVHGAIAIMELIDECMANNWKGIIWDKLKNRQNNRQAANSSYQQSNQERIENRVSVVDTWGFPVENKNIDPFTIH